MENTQIPTPPAALSNKEMAALFFNIATVLRDGGNTNPWRTRAYERAARALMGLSAEAAQTLAEKAGDPKARVPFRRWQHIGKKLHAKINEMVQSGSLMQYGDLLADLPPHQAGLMIVPGIGPRMADRIFQLLGITTKAELVRAARNGSLHRVPGMGPKRVRVIAALAPSTMDRDAEVLFADDWNLFSATAETEAVMAAHMG